MSSHILNEVYLREVSFTYSGQLTPVLNDLSFRIGQGEFVGLFGPNGSGKSTLLRLIAALMRPTQGKLFLNGIDYAKISRREVSQKIALSFQETNLPLPARVRYFVLSGRYPHLAWYQFWENDDHELMKKVIQWTSIDSILDRSLNELSGGEKQRVMIARALMQSADLLLFDETTAHLDPAIRIETLELLKKLQVFHKKTIVLASHDLSSSLPWVSRAMLLNEGCLVFDGPPQKMIQSKILEETFKCRLSVDLVGDSIRALGFYR